MNILILVIYFGKSHYFVFEPIIKELLMRGHNITLLANSQIPESPDFRVISLAENSGHARTADVFTMKSFDGARTDMYGRVTAQARISRMHCENLASNKFQSFIRENNTFDLIIAEIFNTNCFYGLMNRFNAPVVGVSSTDFLPWMNQWFGSPENPAYIPNLLLDHDDRMTFMQRVENTLMLVYSKLAHKFLIANPGNEFSRKYLGIDLFEGGDILYNFSLILLNRHFTYQTSKPLSPNVIEIGGIHLANAKRLPENLESIVANASDGVIYMSMGSTLRGSSFPEEKRELFLKVFSNLKQTVIWKWENDTMGDLPINVKTFDWIPQLDLLCHPNVKLFITHGGLLGGQESIHCGVPMLILPQFADQHSNAASLSKYGISLTSKLSTISEEEISDSIQKLLSDKSSQNAKLHSERFRDRPMSPLDTAIYWIEYVARHKGAAFMRPAIVDMPFYKYLLLDVLGFLLFVTSVAIYFGFKIMSFVIRIFFYRKLVPKVKTR